MLQHSIGDVGNLDHQSSSSLVAEGEGLVRLGVAQQADLRVAVGFQLQKGKFFTCRNHTINHYGIIYNMGGRGVRENFVLKTVNFTGVYIVRGEPLREYCKGSWLARY